MLLFHYTSRLAAQLIAIDGKLVPRRGTSVWLSSTLYERGWLALEKLAIPSGPIEVAFYIDHPSPPPATAAVPYRIGRSLFRRGGGPEVKLLAPVPVVSSNVLQPNVP
jgi:hypothetical protein